MKPLWHNQIVVGDALHLLRALPCAVGPIPLFLFSPPYNLNLRADGRLSAESNPHGAHTRRRGHYRDQAAYHERGGSGKWRNGVAYDGYDDAMPWPAYRAWLADLLEACWRALSPDGAIFFNHKPRVQNGVLIQPIDYVPAALRPAVRQIVIWARAGGVNMAPTHYMPTHEQIVIIAKEDWRLKSKGASGVGDVWSIPQEVNTWHPAPFPLALARQVLETTGAPLVCDPFIGSGTTGKAARRLGVSWLGFERSEAYAARATAEITAVQPIDPAMREVIEQGSLFCD